MPTKKPITITPKGTATSNAWKLAQRIPMLAPQNPIAPATARPPCEGWRMKSIAVRVPCANVAGAVASQWAILAKRPEVILAMRRSKSSGSSASSRHDRRSRPRRAPPGRS